MDAATETAIRTRIGALQGEIRELRKQPAEQPKVYMRVLDLVKDGCNTSCDIADELPTTPRLASAHLRSLYRRGLVRRTGRIIQRDDGKRLVVWEIA